ncbi:MAG: hypothetical protein ATN35_08840 [Epulopiscium sp. Nele67-Bin004]|nr:MAG: hypothetical protein ATN35_08840 [Epulopiscium sp. Nele67-Bin004]
MTLFEFDKIKQVAQEGNVYGDMLKDFKAEALDFAKNFEDTPAKTSDWGHNYFCVEDGERLIFDLNKPHEHECMLCGKVYKSKQLDNVWVYFYRNNAILVLLKLALTYKLEKDEECLELYKKILGYYAEHYTEFELHAKDKIVTDLRHDVGGAARMMPQGLNEAIIMIRIALSLEILKGEIDQEFVEFVQEKMFRPAISIMTPQIAHIHNIPCWLNSAVGVLGLSMGDQELIDLVFNSEFDINQQLLQGVTGDRFWYEGSTHYNFFLLEGITNLLIFAKMYDQEFAQAKIVEEMLVEAYYYSLDNDVLPNPNDSWPNVNLKTYEYIYCVGAKVFGEDSEVGNIYKNILAKDMDRVPIPLSKPLYYKNLISLEKLLYFPDINIENRTPLKRTSKAYRESGFGILRNDNVNVFIKYGHRGPSHAHPDKMTIEVLVKNELLSRDLSNCGYASRLCNEWHRKTLSHNTIIVDGENQVSMEMGELKEFTENSCKTFVENVYDGVDYARNISLTENGFEDHFEVTADADKNFDWIFHSEATLETRLEGEDAELGYNDHGYQHVKNIRRVAVEGDTIDLKWNLNGVALVSTVTVAGKEMFIADTFDNPVSRYRTAIILRDKAQNASFDIKWTIVE